METSSENVSNNSQNIKNNIKIHIPMKVFVLFMSGLKRYFTFDLDITHIEQCDFHVRWVIYKKTHPENHLDKQSYVKQDVLITVK